MVETVLSLGVSVVGILSGESTLLIAAAGFAIAANINFAKAPWEKIADNLSEIADKLN